MGLARLPSTSQSSSDAVNDLALHFLGKLNIAVVKDIERDEVEFICKVKRGMGVGVRARRQPSALRSPLAAVRLRTLTTLRRKCLARLPSWRKWTLARARSLR